MSLGHLIRKNTAWLMGGSLTNQALQFLAGIALARILVPEDFGLLVTIQVLTGALGFIAGGGMGEALVQAKTLGEKDFHIVFTAQLAICLLIYGALFTIAPFFSDWLNEPRYTDLLRVSAITFLIRPFSNIPQAMLRRDMRFKPITLIRFCSVLTAIGTSITLALYGLGVWALVFGGLASAFINLLLLLAVTKWVPGFSYEKSSIKRLGGYGIKISLNEIILHLRTQIPNLIISRMLGASQVGLFNKADSLSVLPVSTIGGSTYQTVFRALSSIQTNLDQSKYIYYRTVALLAVYTFPFYIGLLWIAEPFIFFVYGEKWIASAAPLQILAFAGMLGCLSNPSGAVIAAQNRLGKEIQIQIETLVLFVIAGVIGVRWGIVGVAAALLPCHLYLALRMTTLANSCIHGRYADLFKALQPALILNSALLVILYLTTKILPETYSTAHPGLFLVYMVTSGGLAYTILFLFYPHDALRAEQERWKKLLRLIPAQT